MQGQMRWTVDTEEISIHPGECIFMNARIPHATYAVEDTEYFLLQFPRDKLFSSSSDDQKFLRFFMNGEQQRYCLIDGSQEFHREFIDTVRRILLEITGEQAHREAFIHIYSNLLLAILMRAGVVSSDRNPKGAGLNKILPVIRYIDSHYAEAISLDTLSSVCGFNKMYLCRLFRQITGKTVTEYMNFVRIERSIALLSETDLSITEVSLSSGFSNLSHFNRTFLRHTGCTPSSYRKGMHYDL